MYVCVVCFSFRLEDAGALFFTLSLGVGVGGCVCAVVVLAAGLVGRFLSYMHASLTSRMYNGARLHTGQADDGRACVCMCGAVFSHTGIR